MVALDAQLRPGFTISIPNEQEVDIMATPYQFLGKEIEGIVVRVCSMAAHGTKKINRCLREIDKEATRITMGEGDDEARCRVRQVQAGAALMKSDLCSLRVGLPQCA